MDEVFLSTRIHTWANNEDELGNRADRPHLYSHPALEEQLDIGRSERFEESQRPARRDAGRLTSLQYLSA